LCTLSAGRLDRDAARRFWLESPWVGRHDLGACSVEAFAEGAIAELQLQISRDEFVAQYSNWVKGAYPGAHQLLEGLAGRYRLATLTNNNATHYQRIERDLDLARHFSAVFASHQIGMKKPDPEVYLHVTQALGVAPERIAFFDDNTECLEPARALGWQCFHTVGLSQLVAAIAGIEAQDAATNR
jgi:putative hydrolase of the HAD superfamily